MDGDSSRCAGYCRLPGWAVTVGLVTVMAWIAPGQGLPYVAAYNTLASNYNDRVKVVGGNGVACKGPLEPVQQQDLDNLRQKVLTAMQVLFVVDPTKFDLGATNAAKAFPFGLPLSGRATNTLSLMSSIGDGKGWFTKLPADYTRNGETVHAASFNNVPPLWIHFTELDDAIQELRYLAVAPGGANGWGCGGENNYKQGWTRLVTNWSETIKACEKSYNATPATQQNKAPTAYSASTGPYQGHALEASLGRLYAYFTVTGLNTEFLHTVRYYVLGLRPTSTSGYYAQFDNMGAAVMEGYWLPWCTVPQTGAGVVRSTSLGDGGIPAWCSMPGWGEQSWRGYQSDGRAMVEWHFPNRPLVRPAIDDPEDDGLLDLGCGCSDCSLEARAQWSGSGTDAKVLIPLGVSDGALSGGVRVKAYLTDYEINGTQAQMYSLSTKVHATYSEETNSEFVVIKRPSGTEVLFCTTGRKAGQAVDLQRTYRAEKTGSTVILRFPGSGRDVTHVFGDGKLVAVAIKEGTRERQADWRGTIGSWPGLYTEYLSSPSDYQRIQYVTSPGLTAQAMRTTPTSVVTVVEYRYQPAGPTNRVSYYQGSKGFRTTDAAGQTLWDTRVVTDAAAGLVKIWSGIRTNSGLRIAREERRRTWRDAEAGLTLVEQTSIADSGQPGARSNTVLTAMMTFPWGDAPVGRTAGSGSPEALTTTYTYYTNGMDMGSYGRLHREIDGQGRWTDYEYDASGRIAQMIQGFKNAPPGAASGIRVQTYVYAGDPQLAACGLPAEDLVATGDSQPRLILESLDGFELSRTYVSCRTGQETRVRCAMPGAVYGDASNVVSVTRWVTNGVFKGRELAIQRPDGTFSTFAYTYDDVKSQLTVSEENGCGTAGVVTNGTRTITVTGAGHRTLSLAVTDMATGLRLSGQTNTYDGQGRRLSVSNTVAGTVTRYVQGCCGPEVELDEEGIASTNVYDELGRLYATERLGLTTFRKYDVMGNVIEMRRNADELPDRCTTWSYDAAGRQIRAEDEGGRVTEYRYATNAWSECETVTTFPDGSFLSETRYRDGRLRCVTGTAVRAMTYDYGTDEGGYYAIAYHGTDTNAAEWQKLYYNLLGLPSRLILADGYTVELAYDAGGRMVRWSDGLTTRLTEYGAGAFFRRGGIDVDGNGHLDLAGQDAIDERASGYSAFEGRAAHFDAIRVYDRMDEGHVRTQQVTWQSLDGTARWIVTPGRTGRVDVVRNPSAAARTETAVAPDGTRCVQCYTNGLLKSECELAASGAVLTYRTFCHDAYGRVVSEARSGGDGSTVRTDYQIDAAGLVTGQVVTAGALTRTTSARYDGIGRCVQTTLSDGGVVDYAYEPGGHLTARTGARTLPRRMGYDSRGRLAWQATFREGTNGTPDITRWLYDDQRGWPIARIYVDGSTNRYAYRPDGRLDRRISARGVETTYGYDVAGRLTQWSYSDGTPGVELTLDRLGQIAVTRDGSGVRSNRYDDSGAALAEASSDGETLAYTYDAIGRRTSLTVGRDGDTPAYEATYGFDIAGRLNRVTGAGQESTYAYADDGVAVTNRRTTFNGQTILAATRALDPLGRVFRMAWFGGGNTMASADYEYNTADQQIRRVEADQSSWTYAYDDYGQVRSGSRFRSDGVPLPGGQYDYGYDTAGNRLWWSDASGARLLYAVNALNQYTQIGTPKPARPVVRSGTVFKIGPSPRLASSSGVADLAGLCQYDADGNLTSDGTCTYVWDGENRLLLVSNTVMAVSNRYDSLSRRIGKAVYANEGGIWRLVAETRFVYDGWNPILAIETRAATVRTNRFLWGPDVSGTLGGAGGAGGLICEWRDGAVAPWFPLTDNAGNVVALSDATGSNVLARYVYDPFGNAVAVTGADADATFRFAGKPLDAETGLYYYGYRFYSPKLGRWLSRDPLGEDGGINLYGFVDNDPVQNIDALGLSVWSGVGAAVGAVIGAVGWAATHPSGVINGARIAGGYVPSVLSGDVFDDSEIQEQFLKGQCTFLITINGMANTRDDGIDLRSTAASQTGIPGTLVVNRTHFVGIGDGMQMLGQELGLIDVTARRAAAQIKLAYAWGQQEGCPCIKIIVIAHSQGTMIFRRAMALLSSDILGAIEYHGDGGETFIGPGYGLDSTDNNWNQTGGHWFGFDPIPLIGNYLNPARGFGIPFHLSGGHVDVIKTGAGQKGNNHQWDKFYSWQY